MATQENNIVGEICSKVTNDCQTMALTIKELPYQELLNIDYSVAAQFWGIPFTSVIGLWLFSKGLGAVINMFKGV
ncbi:MAG: hypothetical protein ACL7AX_12700 [Candidatus Arsenophonus phytopathogenicus]|uniref:hypothetical protein n=1 Tax=Arsenophonus sp. PmNCSU2021_1 TaxID=3118989 RepID=UPI002FF0BCBE